MARPELRSLLGYDTVYIIYNIMPSFLNIFSAEKTKNITHLLPSITSLCQTPKILFDVNQVAHLRHQISLVHKLKKKVQFFWQYELCIIGGGE